MSNVFKLEDSSKLKIIKELIKFTLEHDIQRDTLLEHIMKIIEE